MLNLLPPEIKRQRRQKSQFYATIFGSILVIAVTGLSLLALFTWSVVQQATIAENQSKIDQLSGTKKTKEAIIAQAALVEDRLKNGAGFQEKRQWEMIFNEVASATPADTVLTGIDVTSTADTGKIVLSIAGSSADRRSIVLFRDKLEASAKVSATAIQSLSETITDTTKTFTFTLVAEYQEKASP